MVVLLSRGRELLKTLPLVSPVSMVRLDPNVGGDAIQVLRHYDREKKGTADLRSFSYRRAFSHNFHIFFAQFFHLPYFPDYFFKYVKFNELVFSASGEFTNSDKTPPYIDACLQLFPNFGSCGKNALR